MGEKGSLIERAVCSLRVNSTALDVLVRKRHLQHTTMTNGVPTITVDGCGEPECREHIECRAETLALTAELAGFAGPIPMLLTCPSCNSRHVDGGEFATRPHHTHACQSCGMTWRPAVVCTVGVQFLPGFKDSAASTPPGGTL